MDSDVRLELQLNHHVPHPEGLFGSPPGWNAWLPDDLAQTAATKLWTWVSPWPLITADVLQCKQHNVLHNPHRLLSLRSMRMQPAAFNKITSYPYMWGLLDLRTRYSLLCKKDFCECTPKKSINFSCCYQLEREPRLRCHTDSFFFFFFQDVLQSGQ